MSDCDAWVLFSGWHTQRDFNIRYQIYSAEKYQKMKSGDLLFTETNIG